MTSQARAIATRRRIVEVAVELFDESGFSGTHLNQIIRRAHATAGSFYYHFGSKEDVAFAIIDLVDERMTNLRNDFLGTPGAGLASIIEMTFRLDAMVREDPAYRVAAYLEHTIARHTQRGLFGIAQRVEAFLVALRQAVRASEVHEGVSPELAARIMMTLIYGNMAMFDFLPGDDSTRLAESWQVLLPGLVAEDLLPTFERAVDDAFARYRRQGGGDRGPRQPATAESEDRFA